MNGNAAVKDPGETLVAVLPGRLVTADPKEEVLEEEVSDIEVKASEVEIKSDNDYADAGEFVVLLRRKSAEVVSFFKPMKDAAYQAHKAIREREKTMLSPLENAERMLSRTMGDYASEQERKRREQEEALRKAAEEESRRKLEEAAKLEGEGKNEEAEAALEDAGVMEGASRSVYVPTSTPKAAGVSSSKDWEIVSIDSGAVPLALSGVELRPVDKAAVMRLVRASKGKINIPGIVIREIAKMSFRR